MSVEGLINEYGFRFLGEPTYLIILDKLQNVRHGWVMMKHIILEFGKIKTLKI